MTSAEVDAAIEKYEYELAIPVTDALTHSPDHLVDMVLAWFPALKTNRAANIH
jgi:hypothetical protein